MGASGSGAEEVVIESGDEDGCERRRGGGEGACGGEDQCEWRRWWSVMVGASASGAEAVVTEHDGDDELDGEATSQTSMMSASGRGGSDDLSDSDEQCKRLREGGEGE